MFRFFSLFRAVCLSVVALGIIAHSAQAATKSFTITADQFSFAPSTITVTQGDVVAITLKSADVEHGFSLPEFGVNQTVGAGETVSFNFTASKAGSFVFTCSVYCGSGHTDMTGTLVVAASGGGGGTSGDDAKDDDPEEPAGDTSTPIISGIHVSETTEDGATVQWTTDETTTGKIEYGTTSGSLGASMAHNTTAKNHTAKLTGLESGTKYFFRITAEDEAGNSVRSSESSFTTEGEPEDSEEEESCDDVDCEDGEKCEVIEGKAQCVEEEDQEDANQNTNSSNSVVEVTYLEGDDDGQWDPTDQIHFGVNESITIAGTAPAGTEIVADFCCALTQYTTIADDSGNWMIQGKPSLSVGEQYVKVYASGAKDSAERIDFEIMEQEPETTSEEEKGFFARNWVWFVIGVGVLIVLGSGIVFVRNMRR